MGTSNSDTDAFQATPHGDTAARLRATSSAALFAATFDGAATPMAIVVARGDDASVVDCNEPLRVLCNELHGGAPGPTVGDMLGGVATPLGDDWNPYQRWRRQVAAVDGEGSTRTLAVTTVPVDVPAVVDDQAEAEPGAHDGVVALLWVEDITEQEAARDALAVRSLHDPLTGLPNRILIQQRIDHAQVRSTRAGTNVGVLSIDLDNFQRINDGLGHAAGDQVLLEVSRRLTATVRMSDTAARLSGDEFVILCEDLDQNRADAEQRLGEIADRVHAALDAAIVVDEQEVWLSASIGLHLLPPGQEAGTAALGSADAAMYRAKALGRRRTEPFDTRLRRQLLDRMQLGRDLRHALERNQFHVAYQPIVLVHTGQPVAAEALLRWDLPEVGLVPPTQFIELAEESNLILELGDFVLEDVSRRLAEAPQVDFVTMNISARQLGESEFVESLRTHLEQRQIDPRRVAIELTENVLMEAAGASIRQLAELRRLGVAIGVDDFGTGYASLTYLRNLPVSFVKIHQAFVKGITTNEGDRAIVGAVLQLAEALGLQTIAEGVEQREQADLLAELGCTYAQGYFFGRPTSAPSTARISR